MTSIFHGGHWGSQCGSGDDLRASGNDARVLHIPAAHPLAWNYPRKNADAAAAEEEDAEGTVPCCCKPVTCKRRQVRHSAADGDDDGDYDGTNPNAADMATRCWGVHMHADPDEGPRDGVAAGAIRRRALQRDCNDCFHRGLRSHHGALEDVTRQGQREGRSNGVLPDASRLLLSRQVSRAKLGPVCRDSAQLRS